MSDLIGSIRVKNGAARIVIDSDEGTKEVAYLLIDPKICAESTFGQWGKKADRAIVTFGGDKYLVTIDRIA